MPEIKLKKGVTASVTRAIPLTAALAITLAVSAGSYNIYSQAASALANSTKAEKDTMSFTCDTSIADYNKNEVLSSYAAYANIYSADGKMLFGLTCTNEDSAWYNIIGNMVPSENTGTYSSNYLASAYAKELSADYSIFTGYKDSVQNKDLTTTLVSSIQEEMSSFLADHGVMGSVFCYNRSSGEITCMASHTESAYINNNAYRTVPGSTMKLISLLLMEMQGIDPESLVFDCGGSYTLAYGGATVVCPYDHGSGLDASSATGQSCNIWFAKALEKLDWTQAVSDLQKLGFTVYRNLDSYDDPVAQMGEWTYHTSELVVTGQPDFETIFGLIGQNATMVNPIQMGYIAALIAGNGEAAAPFLVYGEEEKTDVIEISADIAAKVNAIWKSGFDTWYTDKGLSEEILSAKTGTAEVGNGAKRLLSGYTDQDAFYIIVENYRDESGNMLETTVFDIANHLVECLDQYRGETETGETK